MLLINNSKLRWLILLLLCKALKSLNLNFMASLWVTLKVLRLFHVTEIYFLLFLFLSGSFLHKKRLASWLIPSRKLQSWKWESSPFLAETRSGNRVVFSKNFKHIKIWRHMPNFQSTMQSLHLYVYNNIFLRSEQTTVSLSQAGLL